MSGPQFESFKALTDELYPECTLEQKLGVYLQHHPARAVYFLLELILELNPKLKENDDSQGTD